MVPIPILIALEEHFAAQATFDAATAAGIPNRLFPKVVMENLLDLGPRRLNSMDRGKMSIQVISHLPHCRNTRDVSCCERPALQSGRL
jgi:hypothetical protein